MLAIANGTAPASVSGVAKADAGRSDLLHNHDEREPEVHGVGQRVRIRRQDANEVAQPDERELPVAVREQGHRGSDDERDEHDQAHPDERGTEVGVALPGRPGAPDDVVATPLANATVD